MDYATGIDLSECRRITSIVLNTDGFPSVHGRTHVSIRQELGGQLVPGELWTAQFESLSGGLSRVYAATDGSDTSDPIPVSTGVLHFYNQSVNAHLVIHEAWITCTPWT